MALSQMIFFRCSGVGPTRGFTRVLFTKQQCLHPTAAPPPHPPPPGRPRSRSPSHTPPHLHPHSCPRPSPPPRAPTHTRTSTPTRTPTPHGLRFPSSNGRILLVCGALRSHPVAQRHPPLRSGGWQSFSHCAMSHGYPSAPAGGFLLVPGGCTQRHGGGGESASRHGGRPSPM